MFLLVILSCIVLAHTKPSGPILHPHNLQPYNFGYSVKDHFSEQHRHEAGNGHGAVVGNYGFTDARGIARQVNYVADHAGFRAQVRTNEPGTANQNPAAVHVISHQPPVVEPLPHPVAVVSAPVVHDFGTGLVF